MSSDLRVALRIQANSGNSRREVQALERDLRKAGKDGAKALGDEAGKAGVARTRTAQTGAASYRIVRQVMRDAASQGAGVFRQDVMKTQAELKQLGQVGRQAGREAKAELVKADREGVQPLARSVDKAETSLRRLAQNGGRHLRALKTVAATVRTEFDRLKSFGSSTMGQLAGFGVGVGVASGLTGSARLDRQLIRTQQTAGMSVAERGEWRGEQWRLAKDYGVEREQVQVGFDTLIASGLSYPQAKNSAGAIAQATAVTGADSGILAKALVSGANAYDIDLSQPKAAYDLLQKMIVAGRLGNAELENLADIFPKVGGDAKKAGMSMAQSLSFVETLSLIELAPDRLGTLAQSTLRMFTNGAYREDVTDKTGVEFFKGGKTRNAQDVFVDLQRKYKTLKSDEERAKFMSVVFGKMDQDTQKGVNAFMTGNRLDKFAASTGDIDNAKGVIEKDLADNLSSSTAVGSRMKATLGEAIDRMAQPLNKGFADMGSYLLDDLNLSGEQMLAGGVAAGVGGYYAGRSAKAGAGALLNKFIGGPDTLKNLAVGKVLEEATGVNSVFVTNWPAGFGGSMPGVDMPGRKQPGGKPGGGWSPLLAWAGLGLTAMQLGGSTGQSSDAERLAMVPRNKLLNDGQQAYQAAFYRNRMELDNQTPTGQPYAERQTWLNDSARRLAQDETGLTSYGSPVAGAQGWAAGVANRLTSAALVPPGQGAAPGAAESRLAALLSKPLVVEVRTDSHMFTAEVERRTDIQMRRGQ
ncbi:phage tail tape measure protein [Pseudomonas anguilliseptica]|uniref:phage tail tape measure protein n=1 Tax=Pseudomonas anguilliseptica TaxID=53406 RepID=UPI00325AF78B